MVGIIVLVLGSLIIPLFYRSQRLTGITALLFLAVGAIFLSVSGVSVLISGPTEVRTLLTIPVIGLPIAAKIDYLSAFYLVFTPILALLACVYSIPYLSVYQGHHTARHYPFWCLLLAGSVIILVAWDALLFIVGWEVLGLSSYFLITYLRNQPSVLRAGFRYLVASHAGTACLFVATLILFQFSEAHSLRFDHIRSVFENLSRRGDGWVHTILALLFIGLGTKAALFPFGFWLPEGYPLAPSATGALLASTETKLAVYGFVRLFVGAVPLMPALTVWGQTVAIFGALTLSIGTVTAFVQTDSRRLLSFYVIGQVGYMILAIGMGLTLLQINPALATVAIAAGLFHMLNNAIYKSLLFLTAGSIFFHSGERDLGRVSGLMTVTPVVGWCAIVGSLAIAGVPPLNGFSSKWLIFADGLTAGRTMPLFSLLTVVAIFISAVTLGSFLKFTGTAFLGQVHPPTVSTRARMPLSMQTVQLTLALICIIIGLIPAGIVSGLYQVVASLLPENYTPPVERVLGEHPVAVALNVAGVPVAVWNPLPITLWGFIGLALSYVLYKMFRPARRTSPVWQCGSLAPPSLGRYHVHGYYQPFKDFLSFRIGRHKVRTTNRLAIDPSSPVSHIPGPLDFGRIYSSVISLGRQWCEALTRINIGVPYVYLIWMLLGLIGVIVLLYVLSLR